MSKIRNREAAPPEGASVEYRLARLLDSPHLAQVVPHLPSETLHQLIRARGLDACAELVIAATPAQITSVLDLDLWNHTGENDRFDVDRFGEWLEALVDTGSSVAARTLASLDRDLVTLGLSRYVRVLDAGIFEPTAQSDDETVDRHEAMRDGDSLDAANHPAADGLECEVGGYIVRARRADAWDAIVALLVTLDAEHARFFHGVMEGCRRLSNSRPEIDGLDDLLMAPEQHLHDVAIERERRRSQQGYATPADARAFLEMARRRKFGPPTPASGSVHRDPLVAAYFRALDDPLEESGAAATRPVSSFSGAVETQLTDVPASIDAVIQLLTEAGVMPQRPRALLEPADADPGAIRLARLRRLMAGVRERDETAYLKRSRELAFLANTLLAGCSVQSRPFTPAEASDAAAATCNLGFEYWPGTGPPDEWLIDHDLVSAFEVGWAVLHQDVSLFAVDQLIATLSGLHCVDRDIRSGMVMLQRALVAQRDAGTPWRAREAAEVLAMLDMTVWIGVLGLLDECPIMPDALSAVLARRTTTVSPTAFAFISTAGQVGEVRSFAGKLSDLLSR